MKKIRQIGTGHILYEGEAFSYASLVQRAVQDGVSLKGANLDYLNLSLADLDEADLQGASFQNANLTGANLSGSLLAQCDFSGATLYGLCICESDLTGSDFRYASFGGTDIAGTQLSSVIFNTPSALTLPFREARPLQSPAYWQEEDGQLHAFTNPPVVILGLDRLIVRFDQWVRADTVNLSLKNKTI